MNITGKDRTAGPYTGGNRSTPDKSQWMFFLHDPIVRIDSLSSKLKTEKVPFPSLPFKLSYYMTDRYHSVIDMIYTVLSLVESQKVGLHRSGPTGMNKDLSPLTQ